MILNNLIEDEVFNKLYSKKQLQSSLENLEFYREKIVLILRILNLLKDNNLEILKKNLFYYYIRPYEITPQVSIIIDGFYETIISHLGILNNKDTVEDLLKNIKNSKNLKKEEVLIEFLNPKLEIIIKLFDDMPLLKQFINQHLELSEYIFNLKFFTKIENLRGLTLKSLKILRNLSIYNTKYKKSLELRKNLKDTIAFLTYITTNIVKGKFLLLEYEEYINRLYNIVNCFENNQNLQNTLKVPLKNLALLNKDFQISKMIKMIYYKHWLPILVNYYYLVGDFYEIFKRRSTINKARLKGILYGSGQGLLIGSVLGGIIGGANTFFDLQNPIILISEGLIWLLVTITSFIEGYKEGFKRGNIVLNINAKKLPSPSCNKDKINSIKIPEKEIEKGFTIRQICGIPYLISYYPAQKLFIIKKTFSSYSFKDFSNLIKF